MGYFTLDNATNNQTAMEELSELLAEDNIKFDEVDHRIMCFPHVINICVHHIIEEHMNTDFSEALNVLIVQVGPQWLDKKAYVEALKSGIVDRARAVVHMIHASGM
jgi:hypothetical protein